MHEGIEPIKYYPGIFDKYKAEDKLEEWRGFPELMWGLGYEMDCEESFIKESEEFLSTLKTPSNEREKRRNTLYYLEQKSTNKKIVGDYLFSHWRYWTHWSWGGYDKYVVDYLRRIIGILEAKYEEPLITINEFVKQNDLPEMRMLGKEDESIYYIESNLNSDEDNGIPMIIHEDSMTNSFEILDSDGALDVMGRF